MEHLAQTADRIVPGQLATGDALVVSERGDKQGIDVLLGTASVLAATWPSASSSGARPEPKAAVVAT